MQLCLYFYSIVSVQKNLFEWGLSAIPHSEDAVLVSQSVGNYFIR
jgi:hypothetical protein